MTKATCELPQELAPPVVQRSALAFNLSAHPSGSNENAADAMRYAPQSWSDVLTTVQAAARHAKEVERRAHEQRLRLRELIAQVREHLLTTRNRAEAAEAREQEVRSQAEAAIRAAEERARAAEERARVAEGWLIQIADVVRKEFPNICASAIDDHERRSAA